MRGPWYWYKLSQPAKVLPLRKARGRSSVADQISIRNSQRLVALFTQFSNLSAGARDSLSVPFGGHFAAREDRLCRDRAACSRFSPGSVPSFWILPSRRRR